MQPSQKHPLALFIQGNDRLYEQFYQWLAGQYDHTTGGFYYARSSFNMENFEPDIESTGMAINIMQRSGLLASMPEDIRLQMINFFQNKQDPQTGYFYDRDEYMREDEVMVARALGYCMGSLHKLGGEPRYPLPRMEADFPAFLDTPDTYVTWLQSVDLRNSWRGCDLMSSSIHHLRRMNESMRKPYVEAALAYFNSIQDAETGFWGGGNLYIRISGTFKLRAFYRSFDIPVPHVDRIYRSLLTALRTEEAIDMCWVRNPMDLLGSFKDELHMTEDELSEILDITFANLKRFLKPDGGFSREVDHSPPAPNVAQVKADEYYPRMPQPVKIGQGLAEGDMNAGTQALWIRELAFRLAQLDIIPLSIYSDDFWHGVKR